MGKEDRHFSRIEACLTLEFTPRKTTRRKQALTQTISGSGLSFIHPEWIEPGTLVDGRLRLPSRRKPIVFVGKVVWTRDWHQGRHSYDAPKKHIGVEFLEIDQAAHTLLDVFVQDYTASS